MSLLQELTDAAGITLNEAKDLGPAFDKAVAKIADMTDNNDHAAALVEGAKLIKNKSLEKVFTALEMIQDVEHQLSPDVGKVTRRYEQVLWATAKAKLSPADYDKFHGAF